MARKFVLGLATLIFMASGYITFLAVRGPVPTRILNGYVHHRNNGKGQPDKEFADRVVKRNDQSISSMKGLERETSPFQKKAGNSGNELKVRQQPQSVFDEKLARFEEEKETYQAQVATLQNQVSQLQENLGLARNSLKEAEQAQAPQQVVEEMARASLENEAHRTQVANLGENIEVLQGEPAQAWQDKAAAGTVSSKPNSDVENSEEIVIALSGHFASGQNITSKKSQDIIKQKAEQIKAMPNHRISVEGHTDSIPVGNTGSNLRYTDNMGLSYWRAMSVAMQLIELGVDSRRITVRGYGKTRPVASNETPEGRAKNRRVEIRMIRD